MVIFDSNILIYLANSTLESEAVESVDASYASVSVIETLGFHKISAAEQAILSQLVEEYTRLDLTEVIITRAVSLRQRKKVGLGDAIIAATALERDCELWTANTEDFADIEDLKLHNPLAGKA